MSARWYRTLALTAALAAAGCGDNWRPAPGDGDRDAEPDGSEPPPPPQLGEMIDRTGRPLTAELLIGAALPEPERKQAIASYRTAEPSQWPSFEQEIQRNLAIYDGLDSETAAGDRCRATERLTALARVLSNDRLFLDTALSYCSGAGCTDYFEVERKALRDRDDHSSSGGLAARYDAVDITYTALVKDVDAAVPVVDGVGPHTDVSNSFPFFGPFHR
jgi:hypothetical protein